MDGMYDIDDFASIQRDYCSKNNQNIQSTIIQTKRNNIQKQASKESNNELDIKK